MVKTSQVFPQFSFKNSKYSIIFDVEVKKEGIFMTNSRLHLVLLDFLMNLYIRMLVYSVLSLKKALEL